MEIGTLDTAEDILKTSKSVMSTMGEWELIGLKVKKFVFPAGLHEQYEELRFYVRKYYSIYYTINIHMPFNILLLFIRDTVKSTLST